MLDKLKNLILEKKLFLLFFSWKEAESMALLKAKLKRFQEESELKLGGKLALDNQTPLFFLIKGFVNEVT